MTSSRRRIIATALSTAAIAAPLALVATPAQADVPCTITGFSSRSVEVGLSPKVVNFSPRVSDCGSVEGWTIRGGDYEFLAFDSAPQETFDPWSNSEAGRLDTVVSVYNGDYDETERVFTDSFSLKRNTTWDRFNASPEPVRKGSRITVKGRLRVADWTNDEYDGYTNRSVQVQYRTKTGSYRTVKNVTSASGGYVSTTVTANADGYWRLTYGGNSVAGGGSTAGDFVDVR